MKVGARGSLATSRGNSQLTQWWQGGAVWGWAGRRVVHGGTDIAGITASPHTPDGHQNSIPALITSKEGGGGGEDEAVPSHSPRWKGPAAKPSNFCSLPRTPPSPSTSSRVDQVPPAAILWQWPDGGGFLAVFLKGAEA